MTEHLFIVDPGYCDEYITMTAGLLASQDSNRDGVYENNLDCWYNIVADEGLVVQLAVLDLDMGGRTSDIDDIDSDICFPGHNLQVSNITTRPSRLYLIHNPRLSESQNDFFFSPCCFPK